MESKVHASGKVSYQDGVSTTTDGTMLINEWTVDRVTDRGVVVKLVSEAKYGEHAGRRDTSWVVFTSRSSYGGPSTTRRVARARVGA